MIVGTRILPDRTETAFPETGAKGKPETWYNCSADRFIGHWLPRFEDGRLPRPTATELDDLDKDRDGWGKSKKLTDEQKWKFGTL